MQMVVPAVLKRHFPLKGCGPHHIQSTFFVVIPLNYGICRCQRDSNPPLRLPDGNTCCPCFSCQHSTISSWTLPGKKVANRRIRNPAAGSGSTYSGAAICGRLTFGLQNRLTKNRQPARKHVQQHQFHKQVLYAE